MTYVAAWGGATALAVMLVWFGARPVLHNAVFGPPPARSVVDHVPVSPGADPSSPSPASPTVRATPKRTVRRASPRPSSARPTPSPHTDARSYTLTGGQVVLSMTATSARLVSATPAGGYEVRTWHAPGWLRVDFTKDAHTSTLFCTWNGHAPAVQVQEQ
ncbi:hypothetical protein [Actinoallomurus soli]|uniref:hypothetical protein n=1 Tax=Actinoallomurus soli TaxID=2952535 RepID=UPI0020927842|nr:hypothetical protein [Actinoallomurus soli]MCO5968851.1 hypothetical protein [Actinoallomurus soli]